MPDEHGVSDKPPLLLLHGGGPGVDAASNWGTVADRLAERFTCLAPDLLGFGTALPLPEEERLPRGPRAWARARAQQVIDLLDENDLDEAAVVGNSAAGGAATLALLTMAPHRVTRAIVMGGAGAGGLPPRVPFYDDPTHDSMRTMLGGLVADAGRHQALIDRLTDLRLELALRPGAEAVFRAMFDPMDEKPLDLSTVTTPVLALHGECDRVSPVEVSEELVGRLARARLKVVAGAGHWIHVDRPEEFCLLVEEFLHV